MSSVAKPRKFKRETRADNKSKERNSGITISWTYRDFCEHIEEYSEYSQVYTNSLSTKSLFQIFGHGEYLQVRLIVYNQYIMPYRYR